MVNIGVRTRIRVTAPAQGAMAVTIYKSNNSSTEVAYTTETGASTHSQPVTVAAGATTDFWVQPNTYYVSATNGSVEYAKSYGTRWSGYVDNQGVFINPAAPSGSGGTTLAAGSNVTLTEDGGTTTIDASVPAASSDPLTTIATSGASQTIAIDTNAIAEMTLTANCTLTLSGATAGAAWSITLVLIQGGTGSYTMTWPASTKWNAGAAPTLSTAVGSIDVVTLTTYDAGTTWLGFLGGKGMA